MAKAIFKVSTCEIDNITKEANGTVYNYCSEQCRDHFCRAHPSQLKDYENDGKICMEGEVCASCSIALKDTKPKNTQYENWKARVIEFALEYEPSFIPDEALLEELWKWGARAGGAADDCVNKFRKSQTA